MIRLRLNPNKLYNYAFFCPVSRLHLTVSNPVGSVNGITPAILNGLKSKALLDIDGVVDLKTGTVKGANEKPEQKIEQEPPVNEETAVPTEEPAQEAKPKGRKKAAKQQPAEEAAEKAAE